jgi:hypothetical protein
MTANRETRTVIRPNGESVELSWSSTPDEIRQTLVSYGDASAASAELKVHDDGTYEFLAPQGGDKGV